MFPVHRQCKLVHTFLFPLWFSKWLVDSCLLISAGAQQVDNNVDLFFYNLHRNINSSTEANISYHCSRGRERFALPLPQTLSVLLINSQSLPLFPSHPDPELSPLVLWKDTSLRHPATLLLVQPAGSHITFQLSDNKS